MTKSNAAFVHNGEGDSEKRFLGILFRQLSSDTEHKMSFHNTQLSTGEPHFSYLTLSVFQLIEPVFKG